MELSTGNHQAGSGIVRSTMVRVLATSVLLLFLLSLAATSAAEMTVRLPYHWPTVTPVPVTRLFDPPPKDWYPGHRGVDLAAAPGSAIRAPAAGVVAFAGMVAGKPVVSVDHADGIRTTYEPVTASVTAGQAVQTGQVLGVLEAGHEGGGLHWGARVARKSYIDPLLLLVGTVRLKP